MSMYLTRYLTGEREAVWAELFELGDAVNAPGVYDDARAVARETMRRVRVNVETVVARLDALGYSFQERAAAHVAPPADTAALLDAVEREAGPLPLSLRAFYEEVGAVNLAGTRAKSVSGLNLDATALLEVAGLCQEDPLVVDAIFPPSGGGEYGHWDWNSGFLDIETRAFCFAPDQFHKAGCSGGENYWAPMDGRADFVVLGMYGMEERFVDNLRATFRCGGFRGTFDPEAEDESEMRKIPPPQQICAALAADLLPF